jgi:hypothetical protein
VHPLVVTALTTLPVPAPAPVPGSSAVAVETEDLVTVSADGLIRVLTRDPARAMPAGETAAFLELRKQALARAAALKLAAQP